MTDAEMEMFIIECRGLQFKLQRLLETYHIDVETEDPDGPIMPILRAREMLNFGIAVCTIEFYGRNKTEVTNELAPPQN